MAGSESYFTIAGPGETRIQIRGSEFYGVARQAGSVEQAEAVIDRLREDYPEASHHVPAYRVRVGDGGGGVYLGAWSSDDGEPTGAAGKPILNILEQQEVEDVVVVVVRYFGGTELGVGGLARAYSRATKETLMVAGVVETVRTTRVEVETSYADSGTVRGVLESLGLDFEGSYEEDVRFAVWVPMSELERVRERLQNATSGRVTITED